MATGVKEGHSIIRRQAIDEENVAIIFIGGIIILMATEEIKEVRLRQTGSAAWRKQARRAKHQLSASNSAEELAVMLTWPSRPAMTMKIPAALDGGNRKTAPFCNRRSAASA